MIDAIMYQMAALLPEQYRGQYADLDSAHHSRLRFPVSRSNHMARA
jgi:hypothetical protein